MTAATANFVRTVAGRSSALTQWLLPIAIILAWQAL